ncbi:hypothetical protein ROHU_026214 [Labeo rohita]|uniref:Uncharacterized protein n=1 Tax=Labeo rohita TaxID=84645 RepID=A0A498MB91_LABRO|nr:hypothetical protein ROHU_026214 [Labeo rohita]
MLQKNRMGNRQHRCVWVTNMALQQKNRRTGGLAPCPTTTELKKKGRGESGARCDVELEVRALPPLQLSTKRHTPALVSCSGPGVRIAFPLLTAGAGAAPHA